MKDKLKISLGRQIQLAIALVVLMPASLGYGPAKQLFEPLDAALRVLTTPNAGGQSNSQTVAVEITPAATNNQWPADPDVYAELLDRMRSARSVTITDQLTPSDKLTDAIANHSRVFLIESRHHQADSLSRELTRVARDVGFALEADPSAQSNGLLLWHLGATRLRPDAPLLPLLANQQWREKNTNLYEQSGNRVLLMKATVPTAIDGAKILAMPKDDGFAMAVDGQDVFIGASASFDAPLDKSGRGIDAMTPLIATAYVHSALASSGYLTQPNWAMTVNWLLIALGMFVQVSWLWREPRKHIAIIAGGMLVGLIVLQWIFAHTVQAQIDVARSLLALGLGFGACYLLTPDARSNRRASLRSGLRYLREERLEAAFAVLRECPPQPALMPALYKLALAFEQKNQSEQARAVFAYMSRHDDDPVPVVITGNTTRTNMPELAGVPAVLGRYEVLRALGRGAMGGVYLGRDPRINRLIALKVVPFGHIDDEARLVETRARFFREAESAGRLTHPNITTIYDSGEEDSLAYIAMEYVPGTQMTEFTTKDTLMDAHQVLSLMAKVAEALHYAHREHVVHRDIKPANLMYDADQNLVKITDFGVARLVDASRTQTGIILGTPSYMSPEQARGGEVTGSSDLFSLGVTLYELLTGGVPFRGKTVAELMGAINNDEAQPVSQLCPDLPAGIDAVMAQALAKEPTERFASGGDMAFALRECASSVFARASNE